MFADDEDWVEEDDVQCLVTHFAKGPIRPCQRTDGDLTVQVVVSGPVAEVDDLVDATNDVWEELS